MNHIAIEDLYQKIWIVEKPNQRVGDCLCLSTYPKRGGMLGQEHVHEYT